MSFKNLNGNSLQSMSFMTDIHQRLGNHMYTILYCYERVIFVLAVGTLLLALRILDTFQN